VLDLYERILLKGSEVALDLGLLFQACALLAAPRLLVQVPQLRRRNRIWRLGPSGLPALSEVLDVSVLYLVKYLPVLLGGHEVAISVASESWRNLPLDPFLVTHASLQGDLVKALPVSCRKALLGQEV